MHRETMLQTIDYCIERLQQVQLWEGQYTDAGLRLSSALNELSRAAHYISRDLKAAREQERK